MRESVALLNEIQASNIMNMPTFKALASIYRFKAQAAKLPSDQSRIVSEHLTTLEASVKDARQQMLNKVKAMQSPNIY